MNTPRKYLILAIASLIFFLLPGWFLFFSAYDILQKAGARCDVPLHVNLRQDKYKILHEDTLNLDNMKIKRVYYLIRELYE
jgi:hypothetical protein